MPLPAVVQELAAARQVRLAWENADALTFEVGDGPDRCFVKWAPAGSPLDLAAEAGRMTWAFAYTPVPRVLGLGADGGCSWLVTAALPGRNAVSRRWLADPRKAVIAIGEGLRALHDAL
ncbi:MAG TPA: phosphotransferase, partial [Streptosporangiaceae bacterium]|nr:phosphotransferase [Streptosporangiaceae bacterium]